MLRTTHIQRGETLSSVAPEQMFAILADLRRAPDWVFDPYEGADVRGGECAVRTVSGEGFDAAPGVVVELRRQAVLARFAGWSGGVAIGGVGPWAWIGRWAQRHGGGAAVVRRSLAAAAR